MQNKITLSTLVAICFFTFFNLTNILGFSQFTDESGGNSSIYKLFEYATMLFFFLYYLFYKKFTQKQVAVLVGLLGYSILSAAILHNMNVLMIMMMIFIAKDLPYKFLLKYNNLTLLVFLLLIFASSLIGITDMGHFEGVKSTGEAVSGYRLGFKNQNSPSAIIFTLIAGYNLWRNKNSLTKKELIVESLIAYITMILFGSRTYGVTLIIYILMMFLLPVLLRIKKFKYIMALFQYSFIIGTVVTLYIAFFYVSIDPTWYALNTVMSTRPSLWHYFVTYLDINFFGNDMKNNLVALDNGYLYLLIFFGSFMLLLYNIIFTYVSRIAYKYEQWGILMTVIAYEIYLLSESVPVRAGYCNILLIFGYLILNRWGLKRGRINLEN